MINMSRKKYILLLLLLLLLIPYKFFFAETTSNKIQIIFRYDDYGITNDKVSSKLFNYFSRQNIPLLVSIIPFKLGQDNSLMPLSINSEDKSYLIGTHFTMALHGYLHKNNVQQNTNFKGKAEFYGQSFDKQFEWIKLGKKHIESELGKQIDVFVPPWNVYDENTLRAIAENKLTYLSAKRNNIVQASMDDDIISYLPFTVTLKQFLEIVMKKTSLLNFNKTNNLMVVMLHHYDFEESRSKKAIIGINEFARVIDDITINLNIQFNSFPSKDDYQNFNIGRLYHNSLNDSIEKIFGQITGIYPIFYYNTNEANIYKLLLYYMIIITFTAFALLYMISRAILKTIFG